MGLLSVAFRVTPSRSGLAEEEGVDCMLLEGGLLSRFLQLPRVWTQ